MTSYEVFRYLLGFFLTVVLPVAFLFRYLFPDKSR